MKEQKPFVIPDVRRTETIPKLHWEERAEWADPADDPTWSSFMDLDEGDLFFYST
jgi:hypothetical protein